MENIEHALKALNEKENLKEKVDELMKIEGKMKGELLRSNFTYLREKEGGDAVIKMEKKLNELGYPLRFSEIEPFKWYKDPFCATFMLSFNEEFGWDEEDIFNLGRFALQYSIIIKITLRYLLSLKKAFSFSSMLWRRNVDYGDLVPFEYNEEKKYMILHLKNYALHPLVCCYIKGCLTSLFEQIVGRGKIKTEEIGCIFNGEEYHTYKISWK